VFVGPAGRARKHAMPVSATGTQDHRRSPGSVRK
jgi:hypothetical protein